MSAPANTTAPQLNPIAGTVLPIKRAEELLGTLPGVISARIIAGETGTVEEIHVLTTLEATPKQTVRNIESALIAHLGMRVDHRKISVATSIDSRKPEPAKAVKPEPRGPKADLTVAAAPAPAPLADASRRRVYFEHVEVRRSRTRGIACRVTLRKGEESYVGEAEGSDSERSRVEVAARAALTALSQAESGERTLALEGAKFVDAFDRQFIFIGITARVGREGSVLTGSCEIRDSAETASALAVLDATNRWIAFAR